MEDKHPRLYYYTQLETAHKILTNGDMWARNAAYLNDADEVKYGLETLRELSDEAVKKWAEDIRPVAAEKLASEQIDEPNVFVICFTENDPVGAGSLTHWVMYAKACGVALEFAFPQEGEDFTDIESFHLNTSLTGGKTCTPLDGTKPQSITYLPGPDEPEPIGSDPEFNAAFIKHDSFRQENEWRLAFQDSNDLTLQTIHFSPMNGLLSPYLDVYYSNGGKDDFSRTHRHGWPVVSVTVGPGPGQDRVMKNLRYFLNSKDLAVMPLTAENWKRNFEMCWLQWTGWTEMDGKPEDRETLLKQAEPVLTSIQSTLASTSSPAPERTIVEGIRDFITKKIEDDNDTALKNIALSRQECDLTLHGILLRKSNLSYVY